MSMKHKQKKQGSTSFLSSLSPLVLLFILTLLSHGAQGSILDTFGLGVGAGAKRINRDAITTCVLDKVKNGKRFRNKNEYKEFNLDYGDAALEVFHSLSLQDIKKIGKL